MKQSFVILRLVLALVAACNLYVAYLFFFSPEAVSAMYNLPPATDIQQYLTMTVGALVGVFGFGTLLPFFRPNQYGAIILMLLLTHFLIFLIDVIVLSRGLMDWKILLPEMLYFLVVSTALVRWYPVSVRESSEKATVKSQEVTEGTNVTDTIEE